MMSAHLCSYNSFNSSRKAFHKVYEWVYGNFGLILKVYLWGQRLMFDEKACLAVSILVHPKSVLQVQARRVFPHQSRSYRSLWTWLCALTVMLEQEGDDLSANTTKLKLQVSLTSRSETAMLVENVYLQNESCALSLQHISKGATFTLAKTKGLCLVFALHFCTFQFQYYSVSICRQVGISNANYRQL